MATTAQPLYRRGMIVIQPAVNQQGMPVLKQVAIPNLRPESNQADIYSTLQAIGQLQRHPVTGIMTVDTAELIEA
ncbi:hypothetical protein [Heliophilum fasciatum]|uniref:DUF1659 domain-containing protein n=1 Tax=Heliophilum fasciatum TaxID=35700 RepID=A0A4R2SBU5_9FIRM|nr:hypothetical protein [Heliophilum fasciatum]MCW2276895.1 hypothetical protein [Heliophilum fasciatum]TCP68645.1 hypothetical protein EDD73_10240 [Heliophilum fasciatum]